ncbi:hypothetical protein RRG08_021696 [Elysia crispata]|uniref:Uncharacterized protein n=1 Tax=Elysia crispata TaxID=231223 RepID=A0AAE0ZXL8_9GAST|nr:hypothetical protein RRG08_021696 [Elysia crispata]
MVRVFAPLQHNQRTNTYGDDENSPVAYLLELTRKLFTTKTFNTWYCHKLGTGEWNKPFATSADRYILRDIHQD